MSYHDWKPKQSGKDTRIDALSLEAAKNLVHLDEPLDLTVKFRVLGGLRASLEQKAWEEAYDAGDRFIRTYYTLELNKGARSLLKAKIIKPQKFVRKATFYWTRNPDLPYRIWALIVQEGDNPIVPKDEDDARSLMFDLEKTFHVMGSDLGKGDHRLSATVKLKWARHTFIESGSTSQKSPDIRVSCQ
ncbi:MAG: hypothetical protein ACE5KH_06375 [Candidatus Geothermarchaeales archaeon]